MHFRNKFSGIYKTLGTYPLVPIITRVVLGLSGLFVVG